MAPPKNPVPLTQKYDNMAKQVMDIHAGKGMTTSQSNEHLRNAGQGERLKKWSGNYDPTREHLNFEVKGGCKISEVHKETSIPQRIRNILKQRGIIDPNLKFRRKGEKPRIRTVANIILGGSRDQMHRLAFGSQKVDLEKGADNSTIKRMPEIENWAMDMYRFISDKFGEKNIAAFVVHLDETNPHIHCTLLPITEQDKFSWKQVMIGEDTSKQAYRKSMTELHNAIAEINAKYGLERGEPIAETDAKHRTTEQYHQELRKKLKEQNKKLFDTNIALSDAIDDNEETIDEQKKTIEENKKTIESLAKEIKHASARVKGLGSMIDHLETYKEDLETEIKKLEADRDSGKISAEEAAKKMDAINKNLDSVKEQILDKEQKLQTAQSQLDKLKAQTDETETRYQEVQKKLETAQPEYNKKVLHEMQALAYNSAAIDAMDRMEKYKLFKDSLSPSERNLLDKSDAILLDGSVFEKMAESAAYIPAIATNLFLGYLDKATAIAESHGGGGSPGTGWGKKDDEDELAFKRRCMRMAMHMMRPQNKVKKGMRI